MIVEQIWTGNAYRNFNYLIVCPETGDALAIDPLDHEKCLARAKDKGWDITQILNTHEHGDHTGGNRVMVAATGAKLLAHVNARDKIPGIDRGLGAGDVIEVGKTVELEALDPPGHTMSHVCLLSRTDEPALVCGDTLFSIGWNTRKITRNDSFMFLAIAFLAIAGLDLLHTLSYKGMGVFPVPSLIGDVVVKRYGVTEAGRTDEVQARFYAVAVARRMRHPAVAAICEGG